MSETAKVSINVPVYNVEYYVERCIKSILNQTFQDFEIIVVNDATQDNSMEIINKYAQIDNRIKIINKDKNEGLMAARRTGIENSEGNYILFCDSDDYLPLNSVELLYNAAIEINADLVIGDLISELKSGVRKRVNSILPYGLKQREVMKAILDGNCSHSLCNKIFKRELLANVEIITFKNFTNGEDGALLYQILPYANKIAQLKEVVYNYMANYTSSTNIVFNHEKSRNWFEGMQFMYNTVRKHYGDDFNVEINKNTLYFLRHYALASGDFIFLKNEFPKLYEEINLKRATKSYGILAGLHYYLISANICYRTIYKTLYNSWLIFRKKLKV